MSRSVVALDDAASPGASCARVVGAVCSTVGMAFVHGHARDTGWVVAHVRAPVDAEDGQLELVPEPPAGEPAPGAGAATAAPGSADNRCSPTTRSRARASAAGDPGGAE
jgi:hypothetical protein